MRTFRLLSFGPSSPCWTAQVAPLYIASQRSHTPACAAHDFASGIRSREQGGARDSVQEVRSRATERSFGSSLREFSELSSTSYGGFGVPGGSMNCQRRLYTKIAGKKGKKSEKDVLVKDREEDVERGEEIEKVGGKKKKKSKELLENGDALGMDDGVANVHTLVSEGDQDIGSKENELKELLSELKGKKKSKNKLKHETETQLQTEQSDPGMMLNGAITEEMQEPNLHEGKGKKKLKNKVKRGESEDEQSEESNPNIESHKKQKEKKKSKDKENLGDNTVSGVVLEDAEESESHKKQKEKKKSMDKENLGDNTVSGVVLGDTEESEIFEDVDESASGKFLFPLSAHKL